MKVWYAGHGGSQMWYTQYPHNICIPHAGPRKNGKLKERLTWTKGYSSWTKHRWTQQNRFRSNSAKPAKFDQLFSRRPFKRYCSHKMVTWGWQNVNTTQVEGLKSIRHKKKCTSNHRLSRILGYDTTCLSHSWVNEIFWDGAYLHHGLTIDCCLLLSHRVHIIELNGHLKSDTSNYFEILF